MKKKRRKKKRKNNASRNKRTHQQEPTVNARSADKLPGSYLRKR